MEDQDAVEYWRNASSEEHSQRMIELCHQVEEEAKTTGNYDYMHKELPSLRKIWLARRALEAVKNEQKPEQ